METLTTLHRASGADARKTLLKHLTALCLLMLAASSVQACSPLPLHYKYYKASVPNGYYAKITLRATTRGLPSPITIKGRDIILPGNAGAASIDKEGVEINIKGQPRNISWILSNYNVTDVDNPVNYPCDMQCNSCFEVTMSELVAVHLKL